jgi:hypothetical protein
LETGMQGKVTPPLASPVPVAGAAGAGSS